jgi:MarR family transcriptional regulator, organic hydroperoxide resistance regulator
MDELTGQESGAGSMARGDSPAEEDDLARRLQRRTPFRSPAQRAGIGLLRAADLFRRRLSRVAEAEEITLQQFNVLRILRGAGAEGLPTLSVAERMIERTPGVTRLLDRLESQGWVDRTRCQEDRRRVIARITDSGRALLRRIDEPLARAEDSAFEGLDSDRLQSLGQILDEVRSELERSEAESLDGR